MPSTANMVRRMPSVFAGAFFGSALTAAGLWNFISSSRPWPSGVRIMVEDIEDVLARLRAHGAELVGELAKYEDKYRLCYVRGPEGIIVALAEQLS